MDCSLPGSSIHGDSLGKNIGVGIERRESSYIVGGSVNWYSKYAEQ